MKIIEKKDNKIKFVAELNESLINSIRRYVGHVLVLAMDELEISRNDSPLYDETVAHRIGLIPIKTKKALNEKTVASLKLNSNKEGNVYSKEITGDAEIVYGKIPLTLLKKGQELKLTATAKTGKGVDHAKFSPGLLSYRNVFNVEIDKDCPEQVVDACPKKILKSHNGKIVVEDNLKCDNCESCVEFCRKEKKGSVKITPSKEILVEIESFGQFPVEELFKKALEVLKKDLTSVSKEIGKIK